MNFMDVKKSGLVILIATVIIGVFIGVSELVTQIQVSDVPVMLQGVWEYIVTFFVLAPVITIIAFGRNIYGYLVEYFKSEHSEEYDLNKLGETLTVYIGVITTLLASIEPIASLLPLPYSDYVAVVMGVAAAVIVILDLVRQQFNILKSTNV